MIRCHLRYQQKVNLINPAPGQTICLVVYTGLSEESSTMRLSLHVAFGFIHMGDTAYARVRVQSNDDAYLASIHHIVI